MTKPISIEVSVDISGLSNQVSGERIVAKFGETPDALNSQNDELYRFLKKSCQSPEAGRNLYSVEFRKKALVLQRRSNFRTRFGGIESSGRGFSSVKISMSPDDYLTLNSPFFRNLLFTDNPFLKFSTSYLTSGRPVDLSTQVSIVGEQGINSTASGNECFFSKADNVYFCDIEGAISCFYSALYSIAHQTEIGQFSLASGDLSNEDWSSVKVKQRSKEVLVTPSNVAESAKKIDGAGPQFDVSEIDLKTISEMIGATAVAYRSIRMSLQWHQRFLHTGSDDMLTTANDLAQNLKTLVKMQTELLTAGVEK